MSYQILVEAKSTADATYIPDRIKNAMKHQDSKAKISFIVTDKRPAKDLEIDPEKFETLDRDRWENKTWGKDGILDARLFFVEIDEFHKVVLRSIDGKPDEETAERVIFVISRDEINSRFK
jgi:hypothetical protein